jgi:hypothetical protein
LNGDARAEKKLVAGVLQIKDRINVEAAEMAWPADTQAVLKY